MRYRLLVDRVFAIQFRRVSGCVGEAARRSTIIAKQSSSRKLYWNLILSGLDSQPALKSIAPDPNCRHNLLQHGSEIVLDRLHPKRGRELHSSVHFSRRVVAWNNEAEARM
jgi:hypothetical protein